ITESVYLLLTQSTLARIQHVKKCRERMVQVPRVVEAARANLKSPPKVFVETAIRQNRGAVAFYEQGVFELAGETPQVSSFRQEAKKVVAVLKDYQKFLEEDLLPRATGDWRLREEKVVKKLELEPDAGISPP